MITVPAEVVGLAHTFPDAEVYPLTDPDGAVDVVFPDAAVTVQFRRDTLDPSVRRYVGILRVDGHRVDRRVLDGSSAVDELLVRAAELAGVDPTRRQTPAQTPTDSSALRRSA
jgi:hypothetical protein